MSRLDDLMKGRATPAPYGNQIPVRDRRGAWTEEREDDGSVVFRVRCKHCNTKLDEFTHDADGNTSVKITSGHREYCKSCLDKLCPKCEANITPEGDYLCEDCRGY